MNKINTHIARIIGLSLLLTTSTSLPMFNIPKQIYNWIEQYSEQKRFASFTSSNNTNDIGSKLLNINAISTIETIDKCKEHIKEGIADEMIKEYVNLTGLSYNSVKQEIDDIQNQVKSALQQPNNYPNHDKNMPQDLQDMALKTLTRNNINPNNIDTHYEKNQLYSAAAGVSYPNNTIFSRIIFYHLKHPTFFVKNKQMAFILCVNETLSHKNKHIQEFVLEHEAKHLTLGHNPIEVILTPIHEQNDLKNAWSIRERQANLHAALEGPDFAYTGMQNECYRPHTAILNKKEHCNEMRVAYALMQQEEKLKQQNQTS
jgi:hypothetical protein